MGTILSTKRSSDKNKIIVETLMDQDEFQQLKGHMDNIFVFSEKIAEVQTNISQRGKNYATKYFLIPRQYRKGFKFPNEVGCQRIDSENSTIFIYTINKI